MNWAAPIYLYLWLAGMAGGAYFATFLADRFSKGAYQPLLRLATFLGIPMAVVGVMLLVIDLGHPIRFWHLLVRFDPVSPMSIGSWILLLWTGVAVILAVLWWAEDTVIPGEAVRGLTKVLSWLGLVFAVFLMAYTGVLLAASNQALWASTWLIPALFVASAISTGVAVTVLTALISRHRVISGESIARLAEADAVVILIELGILVLLAIWLGATATESLQLLFMGALALPFWAGVVAFGLLIPLWLEFANWGKRIEVGSAARIAVASTICVVLGGLILRAVIVIGGQL